MKNTVLKGGRRSKLHSCFFGYFVEFIEIESSEKFYGVLNIFLKIMKLRSLERLGLSDVILENV